METIIGNNAELITNAKFIRYKVFVEEQGISQELDSDGLDEHSSHLLIMDNVNFVATARLTPQSEFHAVMSRIAVMQEYRGRNISNIAVCRLLEHAKSQQLHSVNIHAHEYLKNFYKRLGFTFIKNVEVVNGYQLIEMKLNLLTWNVRV